MLSIGCTITDPEGNHWIVSSTWVYEDYFCVVLMGDPTGPNAGQLGGKRFKQGDAIYIRRRN